MFQLNHSFEELYYSFMNGVNSYRGSRVRVMAAEIQKVEAARPHRVGAERESVLGTHRLHRDTEVPRVYWEGPPKVWLRRLLQVCFGAVL